MKRLFIFTYGVLCYLIFFATFLYAIGFVGNFGVPKTLDSGPTGPLGQALLINALLLGLFAVQHSVMARKGFKKLWTRIIPEPAERSTYVLFSSLCLIVLFAFWQPMGGTVWNIQDPAGQVLMYALYGFGWALLLLATFLLNHFDLFGLRQVYFYLRGKEYTPLTFKTPWLYNYMRHPLYVGWFFIFWATPTMSVAHLVFAIATTAYILVAVQIEERDLLEIHGDDYKNYREQVPMFIPGTKRKATLQEAIS